jgi:hypothetical protein
MVLPQLYPETSTIVNRSIVITGTARSGTRIIGSLLQSLEETEYLFEPLMLYSLVPMIEEIPRDRWKYLFESYLVEEFLFNAMAGRFLNFNEHDYSCVMMSKSKQEIEKRMSRTYSRLECLNTSSHIRIAIKIPALSIFLPRLYEYYPGIVSLVMLRNPESVIGSIVRKGGLKNDKLLGPMNYPPYKSYREFFLPCWVDDADLANFVEMSEVERAAYYYIKMYAVSLNSECNHTLVVDYNDFVIRPREIFGIICEKIGRRHGNKTNDILGLVKEPKKDRHFSWNGVDHQLRDKVYEIAGMLKKQAII